MRKSITIVAAAFTCVGLSALFGQSESAGLFGAILAVGLINANWK